MKKFALFILALLLLAAPTVARRFYFYEGTYQPEPVPRPDLNQIREPAIEAAPFTDQPTAAEQGLILLDLAHDNRVETIELGVLQARLTAREQRLSTLDEADALASALRHARALVVISPGSDWTPGDIRLVEEFVARGGRLLLVGDPSRFLPIYDEWGDFLGLDHDSAHLNGLASRFGLMFQSDYLYNTAENEGNFRNIRLSEFAAGPLVQDLEQLVFYAAHSITSQEPALITAGGATRSSANERTGDLAVAVLAGEGSVLALGDLTFMTEPYNTVYDNDQFVANLADWLSGAQRRYQLGDFPLFFDSPVDLVYAGDPLLNGHLLAGSSALQETLDIFELELTVSEAENEDRDTIFFGLYQQAEEVEPYLAAADVTLLITPTAKTGAKEAEEEQQEEPPAVAPTPAPTQPLTTTSSLTPTTPVTLTPTTSETLTPTAELEKPPQARDRLSIGSLGEMVITGTSLLLLENDGARQVLVVLADTEDGLDAAVGRLTEGDLEGCLVDRGADGTQYSLALCPTGQGGPGDDGGGWQQPQPEPSPEPDETAPDEGPPDDTAPPEETPEPEAVPTPELPAEPAGTILIVSMDQGEGRYDSLTGAAQYAAILEATYDVTIWSITEDGLPDPFDTAYDLAIWTAGDLEGTFGDEEGNALFEMILMGTPILLSGGYVDESEVLAVQRDIQVNDADHPLAQGFESDEVITFEPADTDYEINVLEGFEPEEADFVFVRGPESEESGAASVVAVEDEFSAVKISIIGFPIYLLPEAAQSRLVLNTVSWLLNP
ncbi:MAG: DUF4350 domain-containing protein [Anaerolineae bacterium]|jgi:hypothetical protein